ncbi:MAG: hypothetical protein IJU02_07235 [Lachnospiraceae bacterium]|nr:hypothetical protein [Lachnospiraceae bacterium]
MSFESNSLPPQQLSFKAKNKAWRKRHLEWASQKTFFNYNPVRNSTIHKKINYDLINGKLHMSDLEVILNPEHVDEKFTPDNIPHYPIMNSKLNVLIGEEYNRQFDFRVVITNPLAISEKENNKKQAVYQALQQLVSDQSQSDKDYQKKLQEMSDYFSYEWQDMREIRANQILQHYIKEYNMKLMFNRGFEDAMCTGEEIYQCDIRGGEPVIERVNPLNIRVFRSGYSNKIEDADVIIMEDYWSPGKVIDVYYDVLSKKDVDYIEKAPDQLGQSSTNSMDERDERIGFINTHMIDDTITTDQTFYFDPFNQYGEAVNSLLPFDTSGNVRVLRMYWKSRRRIKKIKSYDPETGEEVFNFYPENYITDKERGEEETIYYINEAWEGTKIGEEIYVNMRPRIVQYNRLSNPSRCHFGIVGSIYNLNDSKPYSLVDMMKPFSYLYDVIHDRLNKIMAKNWGKIITLDFAKIPAKWDIDKWLYFAKHNNLAVVDSFREGNVGAATGKLAGAMNNASSGIIDAELGNIVQQYINTLEFIKIEMSEVSGITKQREGQISNRETVGGVERATLQSSHITEWLFAQHDDVKKRALECFLETAKVALKGRKEKFQYLLSDGSLKVLDIDGDEFAEADYGLVVESSNNVQDLNQKIETMAQAALQNQMISFSTVLRLFSTISLTEKQRLIEKDEKAMQERQAQAQQEQMQLEQQQAEMQAQLQQQQIALQEEANIRDNETRILVATINANAKQNDGIKEPVYTQEAKDKLAENMRQFDAKLKLERDRLSFDKDKARMDNEIKEKQLRKRTTSNTK